MSGFVETHLLEANRANSDQYGNSDSNAEWINNVSDGLKLQAGDKISIESAYISDLGAEDSTIEFKGKTIQETQTFKITDVIEQTETKEQELLFQKTPRKGKGQNIVETDVILTNIKDTDANIVLSYYTAANGEYVMSLPISHIPFHDYVEPKTGVVLKTPWSYERYNEVYEDIVGDGSGTDGSGMAITNNQYNICPADYTHTTGIGLTGGERCSQLLMDGSRYMIFGRDKTPYNYLPQTSTVKEIDTECPKYRDMFGYQHKYIRIRNLLKLQVPTGFNSPSEISSVISDQLSKNTPIKANTVSYESLESSRGASTDPVVINQAVGPENETPCNKLFNSATHFDIGNTKVDSVVTQRAHIFYGNDFTSPYTDALLPKNYGQIVRDYYSAFQYIAMKRPELYIDGLDLRDNIIGKFTQTNNRQIATYSGVDWTVLKTTIGSLLNQIYVYNKNPPATFETERYPNYTIDTGVDDDRWHRDNLNPCFTNFLEENPFGRWSENTPSRQDITAYQTASTTAPTINEVILNINTTLPLFTNYDLTYQKMNISCPSIPLNPVECNITTFTRVNLDGTDNPNGVYLKVNFEGDVGTAIPSGTAITISMNILSEELPLPYTVLNTQMEWNLDNLKKIAQFFKTQERYPELFDMDISNNQTLYRQNTSNWKEIYNGEKITLDTHRLFHLQDRKNIEQPKELGVIPSAEEATVQSDIMNVSQNGYVSTNPDEPIYAGINPISTSFGYDNLPNIFRQFGDLFNTVNTGLDSVSYESTPIFLKYFKKLADQQDWENMTQEEFDTINWQSGKNIPFRCSPEELEKKTSGIWGGFAIRNPSSVSVVPKEVGGTRPWKSHTGPALDVLEIIKSYDKSELNSVTFGENGTPNVEWEKTYKDSIYDTISFICQLPRKIAGEPVQIYTQVNEYGIYDPFIYPVLRPIRTLYKFNLWNDWINQNLQPFSDLTQIPVECHTRRVGYDSHPTAYGNAQLGLYNGLSGQTGADNMNRNECKIPTLQQNLYEQFGTGFTIFKFKPPPAGPGEVLDQSFTDNTSHYMNRVYCGAISPQLLFDTTTSRFSFTGLHSSELVTALSSATMLPGGQSDGPTATASPPQPPAPQYTPTPLPQDIGKECYKINKIMDQRNFSPSMTPYFDSVKTWQWKYYPSFEFFSLPVVNRFLKQNSIIDMRSGVFLDSFNIEKKNWDQSFWGICGFNYDDLNIVNTGSINERITNSSANNIAKLTTNQLILNSSLGEWSGPITGVPGYQAGTNYPATIVGGNPVLDSNTDSSTAIAAQTTVPMNPPLIILSDSARISATNLPSKSIRPYFTIRSNIISDSYFNGGNGSKSSLPIIAVLQKQGQFGDFFTASSNLSFTITKPTTISSITTQIADPGGELARVSPFSSVIYKIDKINQAGFNIAQEVLQKNKK